MVNKLFSLLIVLYPILSAYKAFGVVDLGVVLCALVGVAELITDKKKSIKCPNGYWPFFIYIIITALLVTHSIPARVILYTFLLIMACTYCEFDSIYKYYKIVANICIAFFIVQELIRLTTGVNVSGIFTFLPTIYGNSKVYIEMTIQNSQRSSAFFLEPSYLSQYLFPLVAMELFGITNHHHHLLSSIWLTIVIFFIRSGNGILLLALMWGIWFLFCDINRQTKIKVLFAGFIVAGGLIVSKPEMFIELFDRTNELSIHGADEQWQSSGFIRFFRGYYLFGSLPRFNMIFGTNPEVLEKYMMTNSLGLFDDDSSFINGIQTILCYYGVLGLFLFIRHIFKLGQQSPSACIAILVGTIYLLLSESFFVCGRMLFTIVFVFLYKIKNENSLYNKYLLGGE